MSWGWLLNGRVWAGIAVVAALAVSHVTAYRLGGASGRVDVATSEAKQASERADRTEAARTDEQNTATLEHQHAGLTLAAAERFSLAAPGRELQLRAELADARRVRDGATARAARYRAQAEGDAAARRDLADRCEALDRSLAEGREVAADLRGALGRRDAEVILLVEQIKADRLLLEGSPTVSLFP